MSTNFNTKKPPKELWLIHDPLDGPHLFRTKKSAEAMLRKWEKEAEDKTWDSFWDMVGPIKYIIDESSTTENCNKPEECSNE